MIKPSLIKLVVIVGSNASHVLVFLCSVVLCCVMFLSKTNHNLEL